LGDAASTGSSLMPQKRNPDPFELVRATSADLCGRYAGALASLSGLALSYHRDLQITKGAILGIVESGTSALDAFARALAYVQFDGERMTAAAGAHYTVATDAADALIAGGTTARRAHAIVGESIRAHEAGGASPDWPDAAASVEGKVTTGSTAPRAVADAIASLRSEIAHVRV
jgi:argininosuccinate lyase